MDHLEAIVEIKNIIPADFKERIISLRKHKAKKNMEVGIGQKATNTRNVKGYSLDFSTPTNIFYFNYIKRQIESVYINYKAKFPLMASSKINQIDLLKYNPGGQYKVHVDDFTYTKRKLSIIINLNDEYEGGDLVFTDQKLNIIKRIKLQTGSVVFFPSNFLYAHSIEPITKGTRYSIVAWLQ